MLRELSLLLGGRFENWRAPVGRGLEVCGAGAECSSKRLIRWGLPSSLRLKALVVYLIIGSSAHLVKLVHVAGLRY